jgi:AcrR family transcriptional regulator
MAERQPTDSRKIQIADAALQVIAEKGLGGFTAAAIAEVVGLTDGSLFRHFPSKQAMVRAAIERAEQMLFAGFPPTAHDPLERLGAFFRQRVRVVAKNPGIARVVFSEQLAHAAGPKGRSAVAGLKERSIVFIRSCVEEAIAEGLLVDGLDPEAVVALIYGAALSIVFTGGPKASSAPPEAQAELVWTTLERLLRRPAAKGAR